MQDSRGGLSVSRQSMSDNDDDDLGNVTHSQWAKSVRSRYTENKTGGLFVLEDLDEKYKADPRKKYKRDDTNTVEYEMQQLAPEKIKKHGQTTKFVESLVTGKYIKVSDKFDPMDLAPDAALDADGDGIISTTERIDAAMKEDQKIWVNIINNMFNFTLGLLSGLSLLEVFFIAFIADKNTFIASYRNFANLSCII